MGPVEDAIATAVVAKMRDLVRAEVREALSEVRPVANGDYLTVKEAARISGYHASTIRKWIREGKVPRHGTGRGLRVRRDELDRFLAADPGGDERTPEEIADEVLRRRTN